MKGKAILLLSLFSIAATFKETTEQLLELPLRLAISTVKLPAFFQKFKKPVGTLRVNDTKPTSKNVFIIHLVLRS